MRTLFSFFIAAIVGTSTCLAHAGLTFAPYASFEGDQSNGSSSFITGYAPAVDITDDLVEITGLLEISSETINNVPGLFGNTVMVVEQNFFVGPEPVVVTPRLTGSFTIVTSPATGFDSTSMLFEYGTSIRDLGRDRFVGGISTNPGLDVGRTIDANTSETFGEAFQGDPINLLPGVYQLRMTFGAIFGGGEDDVDAVVEFHPDFGVDGFGIDLNAVPVPEPTTGLMIGAAAVAMLRRRSQR